MIENIKIKIDEISNNELQKCVEIHNSEIKGGLLKKLGEEFLFRVYRHIYNSKYSFLIIINYENETLGFFAGCINQKKFYIEFILKNLFFITKYFFIFLKIDIIFKIFSLNNFFLKKNINLPNALILNFCIDRNFQSKGIGKVIFNEAIRIFKSKNINQIMIKTSVDQEKAVKLYESYGAIRKNNVVDPKSNNNYKELIFQLNLQ